MIRLVDAAAAVGGRAVWSHVHLDITAGEFVAVLGPNGAGKSTLLKALLGLVPVIAGSALVFEGRPGRHNERIGYVPQRRAFGPDVRVRGVDLVRLGLDGDRWGVALPSWLPGRLGRRSRDAWRHVDEAVELVGAGEFARRPIGHCSGGEQQRLLIAQALVLRPELLVLDEPLDSLDVTHQAAISALLHDVSRTLGITVLVVAHDVNPLVPYLDQVIYLANGTAVSGRPGDVITAETLTRLYGTPVDVLTDRNGRLVVVGQPGGPVVHRV